jgi:hypothetical protein
MVEVSKEQLSFLISGKSILSEISKKSMHKIEVKAHVRTGLSISSKAVDFILVVLDHSEIEFTGALRSSHLSFEVEVLRSVEGDKCLSGGVLNFS